MNGEFLLPLLPFPTITPAGDLLDGILLSVPRECNKCTKRDCARWPLGTSDEPVFSTCPVGFSVVGATVNGTPIRVVGVIEQTSNKSTSSFKKQHRQQKIKRPAAVQMFRRLAAAEPCVQSLIVSLARDELGTLHEIKALITSMLRIAEQAIWRHPGESFDEKINAMGGEWKEMYQAIRLLETVLLMTDIAVNPSAARFGDPKPLAVHKVAYGQVKVFQARATALGKRIRMYGTSFNQPRLKVSFPLAMFALMDNALKYAERGSEISVEVTDSRYGVEVHVLSHGQLVSDEDMLQIFDKGFRGGNVAAQGSGLGLFVAQTVAEANGFTIHYEAREIGTVPGRGVNDFWFAIE